jgi:hypothetical protein
VDPSGRANAGPHIGSAKNANVIVSVTRSTSAAVAALDTMASTIRIAITPGR